MNPTHNERRRLVVEFSTIVRQHPGLPYGSLSAETQVFLVEDEDTTTGVKSWSLIGPPAWQYSNIDMLCSDRACHAEAGQLLVDGYRVRAEAYLGVWRSAIAAAIPLHALAEMGLALSAKIPMPRAYCESVRGRGDDDNKLSRQLESPLIVARYDDRIVWHVPLTDVASLIACNELASVYWSREKYPVECKTSWHVAVSDSAQRTQGWTEFEGFELPPLVQPDFFALEAA